MTAEDITYTEYTSVDSEVAAKVAQLITTRRTARTSKDFETADRIRAVLDSAGVIVTDGDDVTAWKAGPDFDPVKITNADPA